MVIFNCKIAWKKILEWVSYAFCVIMVIYQVSDSVAKYFSDNSTYTSMTTRPIQPDDLPSIQFCPHPGWNMNLMKSAGYKISRDLWRGQVECNSNKDDGYQTKSVCPPGWNGKYGNVTYKHLGLFTDITDIIRYAKVWFVDDHLKSESQYINLKDVSVKFLMEGNCFVINLKKYINETNIHKLATIDFYFTMDKTKMEKLELHIDDPNQAVYFRKTSFDLSGPDIEHEASDENFVKIYEIKARVQKNLENNPKADCFLYGKGKLFESYNQCRKEEARSYTKAKIDCIPPMITYKNESIFPSCSGKQKEIDDYMMGVKYDRIKTKCKQSCTTIKYTSALLRRYKQEDYGSAIWLELVPTVNEGQSVYTVTPFSLLEALGSSLGLWLGIAIVQLAKEIVKLLGMFKERKIKLLFKGEENKEDLIIRNDEINVENIEDFKM